MHALESSNICLTKITNNLMYCTIIQVKTEKKCRYVCSQEDFLEYGLLNMKTMIYVWRESEH